MERYDSYKDSGVDWMNKIPSNWEKSRIRMVGDLYGGLTGKKGSDFNDEDNSSNKPFVPFTNIFNNTYISKDHFQYVNVEENENQNRVLKNDLFFLMSSESYEDLGKCSILLEDVEELYLNSFCKGFRIKDSKVYPLFLNYQLLGSLHKEMISVEGNGFTRINLRQDRLLDILVFIPPLSEQQQIVSFLDTKTSLIDSLIEKTQRKIELLKEKRTSLINEVVTTGLNPNVEMKDSGVECIGKIPSDWDIPSLNKISNITRLAGYEYTSYWEEDVNGEIEVLRGQNIGFGEIIEKNIDRISNELSMRLIRSRLFKGDLVFPCVGTIGNCVVINEDDRYHINQNISKITPFDRVNSNFLCYYLLSHSTKFQIMFFNTSEVQPSVLVGNLRRFKICLPPIVEQQQIVEYLDEQTQLIDKTISIEEKRIKLLKEYRQSLISEVVTGKRKVV
ncbi:restriction endonuclease subunit S [Flavobacteriaceae bacterium]|nr:restriction endonuclease subunit S [Flavobacteriaceae bacterium]